MEDGPDPFAWRGSDALFAKKGLLDDLFHGVRAHELRSGSQSPGARRASVGLSAESLAPRKPSQGGGNAIVRATAEEFRQASLIFLETNAMRIHLAKEYGHLPKGHQHPCRLMIPDLTGVLLERLVAAGVGFSFDAPMRAKGSQHTAGIGLRVFVWRYRGYPISDFVGCRLGSIRGLDHSPDGEDLPHKGEVHLLPGHRQTPDAMRFDAIGLLGDGGARADVLKQRIQELLGQGQ